MHIAALTHHHPTDQLSHAPQQPIQTALSLPQYSIPPRTTAAKRFIAMRKSTLQVTAELFITYCKSGNHQRIKELLYLSEITALKDFQSILHDALLKAVSHGHSSIAQLLLTYTREHQAEPPRFRRLLDIALTHNHIDIASILIAAGASMNQPPHYLLGPPLHAACANCSAHDINKLTTQDTDLHCVDFALNTALHAAAKSGNSEAIQWLIEQGLNVDAKNMLHQTPLEVAALHNQLESIHALLCAGASIDKAGSFSDTPLMAALRNGKQDATKALLDAGATIAEADDSSISALKLAKQTQSPLQSEIQLAAKHQKVSKARMALFHIRERRRVESQLQAADTTLTTEIKPSKPL